MAGTGGRGRPGRRLRRVDETSAGGLVVADDGVTGPRAALIGRTDRRGRLLWSLPKGHIEEGETPEDTAVREVAEETGIIGEVVAPLGIIDFWFVADGRRVHKTVHHFLLRAIGGALSDADIEVTEVAWVPLSELGGRLAYADERALVERAPALLADTACGGRPPASPATVPPVTPAPGAGGRRPARPAPSAAPPSPCCCSRRWSRRPPCPPRPPRRAPTPPPRCRSASTSSSRAP
jgi:8-oxo-dGTP pyrophosphatase MutT (NUDIX family)